MSRTCLLIVVTLGLTVSPAWSAPSVSNVSGLMRDGETLVITGSGFGAGPTVLVFDDFESGSNGQPVTLGPGGAVVGSWGSYGDPSACDTNIATYGSQSHSGSLAFHLDSSGSCWRNGLVLDNINANEIFIQEWVYVPQGVCVPGPTCGDANWKSNWLLGPGKSTINGDRYPLATESGANPRFGSNASQASHYMSGFTLGYGRWMLWQFYLRPGPTGTGDVAATGIDGAASATWESWLNKTGVDVQASGQWTGAYQYLDIGGYGRAGATPSYPLGMQAYFDDIYVAKGSNARARVEIMNASTRGSATNVTVCTTGAAGDSWTDSAISCTVRAGSFAGGNVWVYVIDGNGSVSSATGPFPWDQSSGNPVACSDGADNDGDGLTDFPADPGCSSSSDNDETNTQSSLPAPTNLARTDTAP